MRPPVTSAQSLHAKRFRKGVAVALHLSCMVLVATDPADAGGKTMHAARFASVGGRGLSFREMAEVWGFEHAAGHPKRLGPDVCRHTHGRGPGHASTNLQVCIHAGRMLGAEAPCSSCHFAIIPMHDSESCSVLGYAVLRSCPGSCPPNPSNKLEPFWYSR